MEEAEKVEKDRCYEVFFYTWAPWKTSRDYWLMPAQILASQSPHFQLTT